MRLFPLRRRLLSTSAFAASAKPLRVAIAGAGVSGSIVAAQLAKHPNVEVTLLERFARGALPPGLNLLLNHNGLAALHDTDAELEARIRGRGHDIIGWQARTMTGEVLYDIPDLSLIHI